MSTPQTVPSNKVTKPFKIVTFNMGSASDDKLEWVLQYLSEHKPDIMCIQETKCEDYPSFIYNRGYHLHSHPSEGTAGGLLTLISNKWGATKLETHRDEHDVCWSKVSLGKGCGSLVVANTYSRSNLSMEEISVSLGAVVNRLTQLTGDSNVHKVLVGDLNIDPYREWDVDRHRYLSRILLQAGLVRVDLIPPLASQPTCFPTQDNAVVSSHIDVLALDESLVYGCGFIQDKGIESRPRIGRATSILNLGVDMDIGLPYLSQHKPVWVTLTIQVCARPKAPPDIVFRKNLATQAQWKQAKASIASMCTSIGPDIQNLKTCQAPNRQAALDAFMTDFTNRLHRCYAKTIGTIKVLPNSVPAWSCGLTAKVRRKHALAKSLHVFCKVGDAVPPGLATKHRDIKRSLKSAIRCSNRAKHSQQVQSAAKSSQRMALVWQRSKRYKTGQSKVFGDSCSYKGVSYSGVQAVAQALTQKMADVHTYDPNDPSYDQIFHDDVARAIPGIMQHDPTPDSAVSCPFTTKEFEGLLQRILARDAKSPGPDGVPYWMITKGGGALHSTLLQIFNIMWSWELIPTEWGHSHIRYLHKKKSKLDISNYRPISLISCLGKAFTMLWLPRLASTLLPHLAPQQGSKGKGSSSLDSLWTLTALIDSACAKAPGTHVHAMFCDTATAYDTVWRDGLYFTLYSYGVRGPMLRMIQQWHQGATMTGLWYDIEGSTIPYSQGVRQGCVLAPLLYVAFINPLVAPPPSTVGHLYPELAQRAFSGGLYGAPGVPIPFVQNPATRLPGHSARPMSTPLNMFVDDVALLATSQATLQANLHVYDRHCHKWRYKLNWDKFQLVVFGKQYSATNPPSVTAPGSALPVHAKKYAKYLGCWLDYRRTSTEHVRDAESKAHAVSGLLTTLSNNLGTADAAFVMDKKALPHALYGLEATWADDKSISRLDDTISGRLCQRAFGLPYTCRKNVRLYQSGSLHASRIVRLNSVRFAARIARDADPIRRELFHELVTRPSPASGRLIVRANNDFTKVFPSPAANPFLLLKSLPLTGKLGITPHRLRTLIRRVRNNLVHEQVRCLQDDLKTHLVDGPKGRKSTYLLATMAHPVSINDKPKVFEEGLKTQGLTPVYRKCIDRIRYGDMPTPVNPSRDHRQAHAIRLARTSRIRVRPASFRPIGATTAPSPRQTVPADEASRRRNARNASAEERRVEAETPFPPCTMCGQHIPDSFHLTFECPSTLPQRSKVLAAIRAAAQSDAALYRLTYRANDEDLLKASLGGTPFSHIRQDSPVYSHLVRVSAPNWALHFKTLYA